MHSNTCDPKDSRYCLAQLSDEALVAGTRRLVGQTNQTLAALLAHLAEVEARGIHRARACASLYTYCVYELRMSEDAAFRRAKAARLCRRIPALYDCVAVGELHLTGLLMLGPHLTEENHLDVLARAKHRTKREIAKLVRQLDPLPDVPARVEPLGPGPGIASPRNPSWSDFTASFAPVRELRAGERPADWIDGARGEAEDDSEPPPAPPCAPPAPPWPAASQRYKVQFTASQEYVELLERARDLLSHSVPDRSIAEVNLRALRELVAQLEKRKYAATDKPRSATPGDAADPRRHAAPQSSDADPRRRGTSKRTADAPRRRGAVPAAVRRAVSERDGNRCSFVDASGRRCRETALLELHHEQPFARGGAATLENLHLRCRAHNALAAERDFGRDFMERKKGAPPGG